jgi:hypothetical protein
MAAALQGKGQKGDCAADKCLYANCIPVFAPEIMHTAIRRWQREVAGVGVSGTVVREVHSVPVVKAQTYVWITQLGSPLGILKSQWTVRNRAVNRVCLDVRDFDYRDKVFYYNCFDES